MAFITVAPLPQRIHRPASTSLSNRRPKWHLCASRQALTPAILRVYESYLKEVAKTGVPPYLDGLLHTLTLSPSTALSPPSNRTNLHPFLIPLAHDEDSGVTTGLLRWPTPPAEMDLPVVQTIPSSNSLILVAPSAKKYVTRLLAAADFSGNSERRDAIRGACALALAYQNGEVEESSLGLERYLIIKVAPFPDIYEGLAEFHRAKGDSQSGLVTCERAAQAHPGWGRAHAFHARYLQEIGREREASDAAKFCLQMPLWTVGNKETIREMGRMAGYVDDASLGKIYRRLYEDPRKEDIQGGKRPEQVALDRAAYLLDVCVSEELGWEDIKEDLAVLYDSAGLQDLATFVRY